MMFFRKFIRDILTGVDGTTYDAARVFLAGGCAVMLAGGCAAIWRDHLDFVTFGGGFGGLLLGAGGAIWIKRQTEPSLTVTQTSVPGDGTATVTEAKS